MLWVTRWSCVCWLMLSWSNLQAGKAADYQQLIHQEALSSGVPAALITAVIRVESSFREKVISPKGAQGLMQLMPATAKRFAVQNAFDPQQNIRGGTHYLRWLYQRYQNWPLALAAYNAGEQKVDKYAGIPPYRETQRYVQKVLQHYARLTGRQPSIINAKAAKKGRVVQAEEVGHSASKSQQLTQPYSGTRSLEAEARASAVFFTQ